MDSLHITMQELYKQLPLFFNYAALVLKNEILGYTRLQQVNQQLQQEITVRKQTEQALLAAKNDAEAANRAKSVFLANISHELRTPMNAVLGFCQLLQKESDLSNNQRESLNIINNSGKHLLTLINTILDMAKIEAGKIVLENNGFDLGVMVLDTIDMMREHAEAKSLALLFDQSSSFPRFVISDEAKLRQILINLIGNSVKYTKAGNITVYLTSKTLGDERCLLSFAIKDTGVGIAAHELPLIFDTFVQVGNESEYQGTGLGLAIVKQYAQLLGGDITVSSELGKGSVFIFSVPVCVNQTELVNQSVNEHSEASYRLASNQPTYRILIVEDHLENRLLLKKLLELAGFQVIDAINGQDSVEQFIRWQPHFIWMDRQMPVMDGLAATQKIRSLEHGKDVKIVAVTASVFSDQKQEFLNAGVDEIIGKPYREAEIFDCMARQLGVRFDREQTVLQQTTIPTPIIQNVKHLSEQLLSALHHAAASLDVEETIAVIESIEAIDAPLANSLMQHVKQFDFEAITELF
jgi:signal transduction histidine kinase/CheY-like chemotaxis protein